MSKSESPDNKLF